MYLTLTKYAGGSVLVPVDNINFIECLGDRRVVHLKNNQSVVVKQEMLEIVDELCPTK